MISDGTDRVKSTEYLYPKHTVLLMQVTIIQILYLSILNYLISICQVTSKRLILCEEQPVKSVGLKSDKTVTISSFSV